MTSSSVRRATRQRRDALVSLVEHGVDAVATLSAEVGVSPSTVRRDLAWLAREGRIARTYGGALARERFHERSFTESERLHQAAKKRIAEVAVDLVPDAATVFLDAGTTCLALARLLATRGPRTVFTRGLEAAALLAKAPDVEVVLLGGRVQPLSHGLVGPLAALALDRLAVDVAFLGADAVDPARGIGEPTHDETAVKERAAAVAARVVLLADSSKLSAAPVPAWLPIDPSWTLVTDPGADEEALSAFASYGVRVLSPEGGS
ncbi:DeoR/GlpR family DNA-binding transcription regulator [Nocardioides caldifontis]|uniref:DeoR/GlpR family DNA-binding transcription regulator n=1 Tax=Nocardioides caldifontis TaxID=2588938 RepID=UPI0011E01B90|nr:DeoR/GlpR family DNA-binding transcription regulator [Nocardioides caldifontis]